MSTAYLTRRVRFSAAHRYHRPDWDEERNRSVFGRCSLPHGHGHNYLLEATFAGAIDAATGFAVDLATVDALLGREVLEPLDHRHLNHAIPEFAAGERVPTSENLLAWLWPRISAGVPSGTRLLRLRLHEDETFFVDYFGEGDRPPQGPLAPGS